MLKKLEKSPLGWFVVIGLLITATGAVFMLSLPNLPSLMQDELIYSIESRRLAAEDRNYSNHLFYAIFSTTSFCGPSFYLCAKVINHGLLLASALVVFAIARGFTSWSYALLASLLVVLGPTALYSGTFMPETLFLLLIVIAAGIFIQKKEAFNRLILLMGFGFFVLGLASLVKSHALLFLLSFVAYAIWRLRVELNKSWLISLGLPLSGAALTFVVNILGWLMLTGGMGPLLFGEYASAFVDSEQSRTSVSSVWELFSDLSLFLSASLFALAKSGQLLVMMVLPLAALVLLWARSSARKGPLTDFLLITLPINIFIIGAFTMQVTFVSGDDHSGRVLLRYLEWYFPLILIWGLGLVKSEKATSLPKRYGSMIAVIAVLIFTFGLDLGPERIILVDSTALFGLLREPGFTSTIVLIVSILLILSLIQHRFITHLLTLSMLTIYFSIGINGQVLQNRVNGSAISTDYAGQYIRELVDGQDVETIHIVGSDKQLMLASLFQADQSKYSYLLYEEGTVLVPEDLPSGVSIVIESLGVGFRAIEPGVTRVSRVQNGRIVELAEFNETGKNQ